MKIIENITINLSEDDVKKIIANYIETEGYELKGEVQVNVGTITTGYGMGEIDTVVFKGISVNVTRK